MSPRLVIYIAISWFYFSREVFSTYGRLIYLLLIPIIHGNIGLQLMVLFLLFSSSTQRTLIQRNFRPIALFYPQNMSHPPSPPPSSLNQFSAAHFYYSLNKFDLWPTHSTPKALIKLNKKLNFIEYFPILFHVVYYTPKGCRTLHLPCSSPSHPKKTISALLPSLL